MDPPFTIKQAQSSYLPTRTVSLQRLPQSSLDLAPLSRGNQILHLPQRQTKCTYPGIQPSTQCCLRPPHLSASPHAFLPTLPHFCYAHDTLTLHHLPKQRFQQSKQASNLRRRTGSGIHLHIQLAARRPLSCTLNDAYFTLPLLLTSQADSYLGHRAARIRLS